MKNSFKNVTITELPHCYYVFIGYKIYCLTLLNFNTNVPFLLWHGKLFQFVCLCYNICENDIKGFSFCSVIPKHLMLLFLRCVRWQSTVRSTYYVTLVYSDVSEASHLDVKSLSKIAQRTRASASVLWHKLQCWWHYSFSNVIRKLTPRCKFTEHNLYVINRKFTVLTPLFLNRWAVKS